MKITRTGQTRKDLSKLFKGTGAEIGVEAGKFSVEILKHCDMLFAIDLWRSYGDYRTHVSDDKYKKIYEEFQERVKGYNVMAIVQDSVMASHSVRNGLDFVYIDAAHDYNSVVDDLASWAKKVRQGGIVSGHDYVNRKDFGVIKAVNDYCEKNGVGELIIYDGDKSPSWMFKKK